jgi:malonyl-CoA/methylmalonyl-CoA synthetase
MPKGAELSHSNLLASLRGIMLAWRWRDDDVLVHALPLSHQHGLSGLQATLLAGARAVIHSSLDPARLCKAIAAEHATVLFAVPAVYERLLTWDGSADFSSLRLATCGSAPLSPRLWHKVAGLLGQEPLERYGTTETGLDVSNPYDGPRRPGSVGLPLPGIEVEVADERGRPVAVGEDGEIRLRGPHVCTGYWRDDGATRASFNRGGWFRTGDIGRVDPADGYLSITGRLKELIISGGLNVYPREVELVLEEHPSVERAAVVGLPSERWGEEVVALVVPAEDSALDELALAAHARDALAPYKRPKAILCVDSLPLNTLGKLRRSAVTEVAARLRRG